jgi:hypothetical protein
MIVRLEDVLDRKVIFRHFSVSKTYRYDILSAGAGSQCVMRG